jgi:hypothetical protein
MEKFAFHTPQSDLLSLVIEGDRLKLLIIDNKFEQDIFREFTEEITTYMIPFSYQKYPRNARFHSYK